MKKYTSIYKLILLVTLIQSSLFINAQTTSSGQDTENRNVITTAVPMLTITPDSRAAGMGDVGVATSADVNAIYWNASKLAFMEEEMSAAISYTPWMTRLVNDMSISYLAGAYKLADNQTIGIGLKYFDLGDITFTDDLGNPIGDFSPKEFSLTGSYAMKLSDKLAISGGAKFIYSNLTGNIISGGATGSSKPARGAAIDIGLFYEGPTFQIQKAYETTVSFGANFSNIGTKMNYGTNDDGNFIPSNLRLGFSSTTEIDAQNKLTIAVDVNKLLVPTPPVYYKTASGLDSTAIQSGQDPNRTVISGIFGSFTDAPRGFSEEMEEFMVSAGVEYLYNDLLAFRAGYFNETNNKGGRRYVTLGVGIKYQFLGFDFAYLIPMTRNHPLQDTLRFSLLFNFNKVKSGK